MSDIRQVRKALMQRILEGNGHASRAQRKDAFHNAELTGPVGILIDKVARWSYKITDDDIAETKAAGFTEDQIFELVVCAAIGQSTRQYETALAALIAATEQE